MEAPTAAPRENGRGPASRKVSQACEALRAGSTQLYLYYSRIGEEGARIIARELGGNSTAKEVWFKHCGIGPAGAEAVAEAIAHNTTVASLQLGGNAVGDTGAIALGRALEQNWSVTELDLSQNNISDSGAQALARAIERGSLKSLFLGGNDIGGAGVMALGAALQRSCTLVELHIGLSGDISQEAVDALIGCMEFNFSVTDLKIGNYTDTLSKLQRKRLQTVLKQNRRQVAWIDKGHAKASVWLKQEISRPRSKLGRLDSNILEAIVGLCSRDRAWLSELGQGPCRFRQSCALRAWVANMTLGRWQQLTRRRRRR